MGDLHSVSKKNSLPNPSFHCCMQRKANDSVWSCIITTGMCPFVKTLHNYVQIIAYRGEQDPTLRKLTETTNFSLSIHRRNLQIHTVCVLRMLGKILFATILPISGSCQSMVYRSVLLLFFKISTCADGKSKAYLNI